MERTIRFRSTEKEYNRLKELAGELSMSEYIRERLFGIKWHDSEKVFPKTKKFNKLVKKEKDKIEEDVVFDTSEFDRNENE